LQPLRYIVQQVAHHPFLAEPVFIIAMAEVDIGQMKQKEHSILSSWSHGKTPSDDRSPLRPVDPLAGDQMALSSKSADSIRLSPKNERGGKDFKEVTKKGCFHDLPTVGDGSGP
jgi:hypothetical protein